MICKSGRKTNERRCGRMGEEFARKQDGSTMSSAIEWSKPQKTKMTPLPFERWENKKSCWQRPDTAQVWWAGQDVKLGYIDLPLKNFGLARRGVPVKWCRARGQQFYKRNQKISLPGEISVKRGIHDSGELSIVLRSHNKRMRQTDDKHAVGEKKGKKRD